MTWRGSTRRTIVALLGRRPARPGRAVFEEEGDGRERVRICGEPATHSLGNYRFCDRHYARAPESASAGLWRADLISVVSLIAFVVIVYVLDAALNPPVSGTVLVALGGSQPSCQRSSG